MADEITNAGAQAAASNPSMSHADALSHREHIRRLVSEDAVSAADADQQGRILAASYQIDYDTGFPLDTETGMPVSPEQVVDGQLQGTGGETDDSSASTAQASEAGAEAGTEKTAQASAEEESARIAAEMLEKDKELAQLRAQNAVNAMDGNLRAEVAGEMEAEYAKNRALAAAEEKTITEHRENYGEEAAEALSNAMADARRLREDAMKAKEEALYAQKRQTLENTAASEASLVEDLAKTTHLKTWREDWLAHRAGDTAKDPSKYDLAIKMDEILAGDPAWSGKPQAERFVEAEKRVSLALGTQDGSAKTSPEDVQKGMEAEIRKKAALSNAAITTMSNLSGGQAGASASEQLANMEAPELMSALINGKIGLDAMDDYLATLE